MSINYIVYFGFNSFNEHKRGVENVIEFQSRALNFDGIYYVHWGSNTRVYKNGSFNCISIKNCWYWPLILNVVLFRISQRTKLFIHSHNPLFSFCSIFKTNIFTVHDGLYYMRKSKKKPIFLSYIIEKLLYYRCSIVHFISNFAKEKSLYGNSKNYIIIPNTSHFEDFVLKNKFSQRMQQKKSILIVRSIEDRARIDLLIDVAEKVINKNFQFTVAGKGPLLSYYQRQIETKGLTNIELLGYVNDADLLNLYSNCDIVLMTAQYGEGFGLPIIEGYLFNKPVIASNKCSIPEIIFSSCYLFDNTVDSIIEKINFGLKNTNNNFNFYYETKFSNKIVLDRMCKLYKTLS